ncbi:sigma-54 interaction domain-containing protein [Desulforhopalus singaporensis]|uniref:PAS domain S-box-containing protein n=1 Tax=Desulforhopalus singaporensis TaxID=91360 RepID=A0A1H0IYQ1_9BACT|nr:sigma 54-interacting transcriptional regulator [Desulforhopalus singaporensis]SDO36586.1 PAS domain S-box-containing protein [Desulforhopalus singaporensis]
MMRKVEESEIAFSELVRENQDLADRLKQLSSLLDNLPGMVFRCLYDADLTFEYASKGSSTLIGFSPEEIVSIYAFRKLVHKDDQHENIKVIERLTPENNRYDLVYRMRSAWGEYRWIHEQGKAIFSKAGVLKVIDGLLTDITEQKEEELKLRAENSRLRFSTKERYRLGELIGKSDAIQVAYDRIVKAAGTLVPVIIHGESGTGKELAARTIHQLSERKDHPFVAVNCGAISENLLESEFFGHVRGAFSGAHADREGYLMAADKGTLFLDEIGEMSIPLQIKLLRVLDGQGFIPVGSNNKLSSNFRLISATNRDLAQMVRSGMMREDFYYRINTVPILMPPLRERLEDLPLLIDHFIKIFAEELGEEIQLSPKFYHTLESHNWPGNVRELFNVLRRFVTLKEISFNPSLKPGESDTRQTPAAPVNLLPTSSQASEEIAQFERNMILNALNQNKWHMGRTAKDLGISRRTLQRRVSRYKLK